MAVASASPSTFGDIASRVTSESVDSSGSKKASTVATSYKLRGRKQRLTEDPSQTFICDLCGRRFSRREHLNRHHRSLHTQEKPFECNECGKKFSRNDNLAQHAKTHSDGNIVVKLGERGKAASFNVLERSNMPLPYDYVMNGKILFQIAAGIPGSDSELSSEEISDEDKNKRKRFK